MIAEVGARSKPAELIETFALDLAGCSAAPARAIKRLLFSFVDRLPSLKRK